ncbi:hypothetical protein WG66_016175, partial [Moniliophthora roreri]
PGDTADSITRKLALSSLFYVCDNKYRSKQRFTNYKVTICPMLALRLFGGHDHHSPEEYMR